MNKIQISLGITFREKKQQSPTEENVSAEETFVLSLNEHLAGKKGGKYGAAFEE